jgi:hypothetical protein
MKSISKIFTRMLAVAMLLATFTASAWEITPTNQIDVDLQAYLRTLYGGTDKVVTTHFYNNTEHLVFVRITQLSTGLIQKWHFHSNKTKIGGSYKENYLFKFNLICPDGHSTTVKRHISLTKTIWTPNRTNPECAVPPPPPQPPPNKTSISTIQSLYGPNFTVERMLSNRDLFRVTCTVYPYCYMNDGTGGDLFSWGVTYHSNLQKIAHRARLISWTFVAVRTKETVTDQTAKDDIDILVGMNLDGQPWQWVDYSWEERWRLWFN